MKKASHFPRGWDEGRVRRVLRHYQDQSDAEAVAEDEAAFGKPSHTAMKVPIALVPEVRRLLAKHGPANKRLQPTRVRVPGTPCERRYQHGCVTRRHDPKPGRAPIGATCRQRERSRLARAVALRCGVGSVNVLVHAAPRDRAELRSEFRRERRRRHGALRDLS